MREDAVEYALFFAGLVVDLERQIRDEEVDHVFVEAHDETLLEIVDVRRGDRPEWLVGR